MSRVENLWERLVRAALRRERTGTDAHGRPVVGIAGNVASSLANNRDIDGILRAADEIQDEDPNISRILCEHAYSLAQNLDPDSEGRGVLQFKTGLMSVIKQKLAKREAGTIDRSQDISRLLEFYRLYREKNNVVKLREEEIKLRDSAAFSANFSELERKTVKRKRVFATLKVLRSVLMQLSPEVPEDLKRLMDSDETEDLIAYNIIPLDAPSTANVIGNFPEVVAAVSALSDFRGLPEVPQDFSIPPARKYDIFDFLHYAFGFRKDNVSNQREHVVHLLANDQSQLVKLEASDPKLHEAAVDNVFKKSLDNYSKWCKYLCLQPVWSSFDAVGKKKKLLFVSLYFLIWGEAANIRFLPECLCYIFHHMAREMDEILKQRNAQRANSCITETGALFMDQVIAPLYEVVAAVFTFSQKVSVNFQLLLRFIQGISFLMALAGLAVAVILTKLLVPDIFACILAFIPTGWGILSIAAAWKPLMKRLGLWKSVRSIGRLYDAGMGMLIFIPIALFSWFPFVSTFQTRLMFNQAFSRGLEISLILSGNNPNTGI